MTETGRAAIESIKRQLQDLESEAVKIAQNTNAVAGREKLQKWRERASQTLSRDVGSMYGNRLATMTMSTGFYYGDMHDELADEVDWYRKFLKDLMKEIEAREAERASTSQ